MLHYTYNEFNSPFAGEYYVKNCPFGERLKATILCTIVAIGALAAIYTLLFEV